MAATFQAYLDFLDELSELLENLTEIAKEKAKAARGDDLEALNGCMRREQAYSLTLRSMEHKRTRMLRELGLSDTTLDDLPGRYPADLRDEAADAAAYLREQYEIYQRTAAETRALLESNLRDVEKVIEARGGEPAAGVTPEGPRRGTMTDIRV